VDRAIDSSADAVLVAGDFFDSDAAQFSLRASVRGTLERLNAAGIPVVAVAGNHDCHALPHFASYCNGLISVLGLRGSPSQIELDGFRVVGASFERPDDHRLLERLEVPGSETPVVGLLHGDINSSISRYNPFPSAALTGRGVDRWVLGHIHARRAFDAVQASYPGSPQALDPGETGLHGFEWLEIDDHGRLSSPRFEAVSDVRYENLNVELLQGGLLDDAVERAAERFDDFPGKLGLRLRVLWSGQRPKFPEEPVDWHRGLYQVVSDAPSPAVALPTLALGSDARGQAARLLLGLDESGDPEWTSRARELVESVVHRMEPVCNKLRMGPDERFVGLRMLDQDAAREVVRGALLAVVGA
jgi:predicted phosphodiesterase